MYPGDDFETSCEVYCPEADEWTVFTEMPDGRAGYSLAAIGNRIFLFGGYITRELHSEGNRTVSHYEPTRDVFCYDTDTGKWTRNVSMPRPLVEHVSIPVFASSSQISAGMVATVRAL